MVENKRNYCNSGKKIASWPGLPYIFLRLKYMSRPVFMCSKMSGFSANGTVTINKSFADEGRI
jgi:hypothetical protein